MDVRLLYEDLKGDLHRFSRSISRHEQESFDLVQDALEKALHQEELLHLPRHKQKAWFYRVMKNCLIDWRRKEQREVEWEDGYEQEFSLTGTSFVEMADLLRRLPPQLSDVMFKRYWLGMTSHEIGEKLDRSPSTVRYQIRTAVRLLRRYLEEE